MHTLSSQTNESASTFSPYERRDFLRNIFLRQKIDGSFLYRGKGAEFYEHTAHDEKYLPFNAELTLLSQISPRLRDQQIKYVTDVGCGDGKKAAVLFQSFDGSRYSAVDYSAHMTEMAEMTVKSECPFVGIGSHQVIRGNDDLFSRHLDHNLYLFLGGTVGNMMDEEIIDLFRKMDNNGIIKGNKILFSYFSAPKTEEDIQNLIACYDNAGGRKFFLNGLEMLGLDPQQFEYVVEYDRQNQRILGGVSPKEDLEISFGSYDKIQIKKGEKYWINHSRRFSDDKMKELMKRSGCNTLFSESRDGVTISLVEKKPRYRKKIIASTASALAGILLLTAGVQLGGAMQQHKEKETYKQNMKDAKEKSLDGKKIHRGVYDTWMSSERGSPNLLEQEGLYQASEKVWGVFEKAFDLSACDGRARESIKSLIENVLSQADENGLMKADAVLEGDVSFQGHANEFLKSFVKDFGPTLLSLGVDIRPYEFLRENKAVLDQSLALDGDFSGYLMVLNGIVRPSASEFMAQTNTTKYATDKPPEHIKGVGHMEDVFEHDRNRFDYHKALGEYLHSDGTRYQLVLIKKYSPQDGERCFLLATDLSTPMEWNASVYSFSLEAGKRVIDDYQRYWSSF